MLLTVKQDLYFGSTLMSMSFQAVEQRSIPIDNQGGTQYIEVEPRADKVLQRNLDLDSLAATSKKL